MNVFCIIYIYIYIYIQIIYFQIGYKNISFHKNPQSTNYNTNDNTFVVSHNTYNIHAKVFCANSSEPAYVTISITMI